MGKYFVPNCYFARGLYLAARGVFFYTPSNYAKKKRDNMIYEENGERFYCAYKEMWEES